MFFLSHTHAHAETLCTFFAEFGDILECTIMKDQAKRSR